VFAYRGAAFSDRKNYERAIVDYDQSARLDPSDAATFAGRGLARHLKGDLDLALVDFNEAIRLDPKHAELFSRRAAI